MLTVTGSGTIAQGVFGIGAVTLKALLAGGSGAVQIAAGTESPDKTRGTTIVDSVGATWTLAAGQTLKNGVWIGGGLGSEYYYYSKIVHVLGTDSSWYKWTGSQWVNLGATLPGGGSTFPPSTGTLSYLASYPTPTMTDTFVQPNFTRRINIGKHMAMAYCPLDGLIYMHGGDGVGWHFSAFQSGSLGTVDTWNVETKEYAESFLFRGVTGEVVPRGIDHMSWTWSPNLNEFWSGPGYAWNYNTGYPYQDLSFNARSNYASYSPVTKKFTDRGPRPGPYFDEGQQAGWDSTRNRLLYFYGDHLHSVNPTTLELTRNWCGMNISPHTVVQSPGWYDPDTDDYYFTQSQTGLVYAVNVGQLRLRLVANVGFTSVWPTSLATIFIPDGKYLLMVFPVADLPQGDTNPFKLINLVSGEIRASNLFPTGIDRVDCGAYHAPTKTIVLAGCTNGGNINNGYWFHHLKWEPGTVLPPPVVPPPSGGFPGWRAAAGQVAVIPAVNTFESVVTGGGAANYDNMWSSGSFNPHLGQYGSTVRNAGGDGDRWGTEVYISKLSDAGVTYERRGEPSPNDGTSMATDPNVDRTWGEHIHPTTGARQPGVPHNYDCLEVMPPELCGDAEGALLHCMRRYYYRQDNALHPHYFKLAAQTWNRGSSSPGIIQGLSLQVDAPSWCYDSNRKRYWGVDGSTASINRIHYLTFTNNLATHGVEWLSNYQYTLGAFPCTRYSSVDDAVFMIGRSHLTDQFAMRRFDPDNPALGFVDVPLSGDVVPWAWIGYGFCYAPWNNRFYVRHPTEFRQSLWEISSVGVVKRIDMGGVTVGAGGNVNGMWKRLNANPLAQIIEWCDLPGPHYAYTPLP